MTHANAQLGSGLLDMHHDIMDAQRAYMDLLIVWRHERAELAW